MKTYVNRAALKKELFRSAGVSVLSYIIHPIKKEGLYRGRIYDGETLIDHFKINCSQEIESRQLNIDMATFNFNRDAEKGSKYYEVAAEGFLLLYDSKKDCNLRVQLEKVSERETVLDLDTQKLQKGDHYAITLLRPGQYIGENKGGRGKLEIKVPYPEEAATGNKRPVVPPVKVEIDGRGFSPESVVVQPGQGLVFEIKASTHMEIKLVEAFAREANVPRERSELRRDQRTRRSLKRYSWKNPKYS